MRILYDGYIFRAQTAGGISRYFSAIISHLPRSWTPIVRLGNSFGAIRPDHPRLQTPTVRLDVIKPRALASRLARLKFAIDDTMRSYDIFHPTYHYVLPKDEIRSPKHPMIFTVYDLIPEIFAADLDQHGKDHRAKRRVIEAADAIICISENTKTDLQEHYAVPDSKITVMHLAANLDYEMSLGDGSTPQEPYVLFMGNRGVYKNFHRALLALSRIKEEWPEVVLCVVGDPFTSVELQSIQAAGVLDKIKHAGIVSDTHLAKLYRCSKALLYPSLYEGFGIPPLEAMACGTIAITSNTASLPEVVGDAAILVNPESVEEIAGAILSLRDLSGSDRQALVEKGFKRAKLFSWAKTAEQTANVYRSLVG